MLRTQNYVLDRKSKMQISIPHSINNEIYQPPFVIQVEHG